MVPFWSMGEAMTQMGSTIAGLMVAYAMFQNYFPYEWRGPIQLYAQKVVNFFYPYIHVTFPEYQGDGFERSKAFSAIERYLNANSTKQAKRLKANVTRDSESIVLAMADHEEVTDEYKGVKLLWASSLTVPSRQSISFFPREDEKMYFRLKFHRRHRELVTNEYLKHVLDEGKAIAVKERQRKLYTNSKSEGWDGGYGRRSLWSHVAFHHPATFDTLAMDPVKKAEIVKDLVTFSNAKDYYAKIGKAWKRGYLLYGPPGTGKSTMIAAMANFLKYDIYDLELTAVKDNTELRKLLIDTTSKSIIVIEDIDCSLDLTGQRENNKDQKAEEDAIKKEDKKKDDPIKAKIKKMKEKNKTSEVTLSGLLNFIDGLWSACAGERIIVFTTNYVEKLDPALIRRGRMDKRIELTYCGFEAFKILAKNYLDVDMDHSNDLFIKIRQLLEETKMTPADVAENLMPKSSDEDAETCLKGLIKALEEAKEEARVKAEEEEKLKAEKSDMEEAEKKEKEKEKSDDGVKENGPSNKGTKEKLENGKQLTMSAYTHTPNALGLPVFGGENKFFTLQPYGSRCGLSRRDFAFRGIVTAVASAASTIPVVRPPSSMPQDLEKLLFKPDGYNYWTWRGRKIHYVVEGEGFPIVLIHGFGASAYHWRYNIPEWAKNHKVYALDLLGFGWSEKAIIDYDALIWRDQVVDFLKEVVREPAVLVGNSLGGFTALVSAASMQDQVKGVVLLNTAGQFGGANDATEESEETLLQKFVLKPVKEAFQRVFLRFLFWQAKQPARIESVLKSVYVNSANVDDYLINSITRPADDPNAGEVYYRLMTQFMSNQRKFTLDSVLSQLSCPLLLVWGDLDPWVGPAKALRIKEFYPNSSLVNLQAGHCPHDEVPELVNKALLEWLSTINV